MSSFNKVMIIGTLVNDVSLKTIPSGAAVAEIALAINESWTDKSNKRNESVTYVDVTLWGRTAEIASQYLSKGRQVFIEGRLKQDTWKDKETGRNRSRLKVVCEKMVMIGGVRNGSQRRENHAHKQDHEVDTLRVASAFDDGDIPY